LETGFRRFGGDVQLPGTPSSIPQPLLERARKDCYPPIKADSYEIEIDGKHIVAVEVQSSDRKPHFAGAAYVRAGSESVAASDELYDELLTTHCGIAGQILKWKNDVSFYPNFDPPPVFPPSGSLGIIQHTIGSPRFLQLAVHLRF